MTEREISPESTKSATSNSRMGELALVATNEIIPKNTSYIQVSRALLDFKEAKDLYREDDERTVKAGERYKEYSSRMDPGESGLMMMEYNRLVGESTDRHNEKQ